MAKQRAFDHEALKRLVFEHPDWSDSDYARVLTSINRQDDPAAPDVKTPSVSSTLSRKRDTWEAQAGETIPSRLVPLGEYMPPYNTIAAEHRNDTEIRYLREIAKHSRGDRPKEEWKLQLRNQALNWLDGMIAAGQLMDLDPHGGPIKRYASASERNSDGTSKVIAAWMLPGWRGPKPRQLCRTVTLKILEEPPLGGSDLEDLASSQVFFLLLVPLVTSLRGKLLTRSLRLLPESSRRCKRM